MDKEAQNRSDWKKNHGSPLFNREQKMVDNEDDL